MKTKFIVLAPYELNILTAIVDSILLNLASFVLIGDKKKIMLLCLKYNINFQLLKVYDEIGDVNICLKAEELLSKNLAEYIIKGNVRNEVLASVFTQKKIKTLANLYLLNLPNRKWLFGLCFLNNNSDFENQALSIYESSLFLNRLGIDTDAISIIDGQNNVESKKNTELIKMYLTQKLSMNFRIYTHYHINDIISFDDEKFKQEQIRLNFIKSTSYLDLVNLSKNQFNFKTSLITLTSRYTIISVGDEMSDNILFSIFLLDKISKNNQFVKVL